MKRAYALVVALYPKEFRNKYGPEMKLLFADLLDEPDVSRWRTWSIVIGDLTNLMSDLWWGALFGLLVLLIWWVNRSDMIPFDPTLGLVLIAVLFIAAGFVGTRRSGSMAGGIGVGCVAGLISGVTVPSDYVLFGIFPFYDPMSFVATMAISAAVVMLFVTLGAELATFKTRRVRMRRGIRAFAVAWRQDPRLGP